MKAAPQLRGGKTSAARKALGKPVLPPGAVILWGWKATETPKHQMPRGCRFIAQKCDRYGNGDRWRYCQQPQAEGSSYCEKHRLLCMHASLRPPPTNG